MSDLQHSTNLAVEIGFYRIVSVVNAVFDRMKDHPVFSTLFKASVNRVHEKYCMTYFWWVVLGGNKFSDLDSEVIRGCAWMSISPTLFREWLALFHQTAVPIIGTNLTDAWTLRAVPLAHEFPLTGDGEGVHPNTGLHP